MLFDRGGDQDSKNRRISPSPIWQNRDQDDSFLFIYIHHLKSISISD